MGTVAFDYKVKAAIFRRKGLQTVCFIVLISGSFSTIADTARAEAQSNAVYDSFSNLLPVSTLVDELSLDELSNMVVTESKVAQPQDTVTQKIIIQRTDDMEQIPIHNRNIAELMRYTAGQFVNVLSRNDANWGAHAGLGPKYNSYLLDGLPIDSFVDTMSLDPWAFERIEAYKGPASVMYSNYLSMDFPSQAPLAGTTNLVIKDKVEAPMTRLWAGYGTYNTYNARIYHQGRKDNLSYLFGGSYEQSDYDQYGRAGSWLQAVNNPNYLKPKIYGKVSYALGRDDHRVSLFFNHTNHNGDNGRTHRDFDHRYDTANFAYNNQITKALNLQLKAGLRDYERRWGEDNADLSLKNHGVVKQRIIPVDMTMNYAHNDNGLLTVGVDGQWVDYRTETEPATGNTTLDNDVSAISKGAFIQEKYQIGNLVLRGGVRYMTINQEYKLLGGTTPMSNRVHWSDTLWSAGIRYNVLPNLSFYANRGTSFMVPTANQVGGTVRNPLTDSGQLPNPGLRPEAGVGNDVGVDWSPTSGLAIGVRLFYNEVSSAIVDNSVSTAPSQSVAINAGTATARGGELDIKYDVTRNLYWFTNFTYSDTEVTDPENADHNGTEIPFSPDYVANMGLTGQLPWDITISPYFQWVGRYFDSTSRKGRTQSGNYGVLSLRLNKNLFRNTDRSLSLTVDLNNLTDERYKNLWDFQDTGFNTFAGLQLIF